jgi:hypothetical protein
MTRRYPAGKMDGKGSPSTIILPRKSGSIFYRILVIG